ncbi:GNAT family N-acetyltransferase [Actinoplanes sp. CA-131856]
MSATSGPTWRRPAGEPNMLIKVIDQITDAEQNQAMWTMYTDAFEELNHLAVQRHLMYKSEFDEVMADARVGKYLALDDDGTMCGVATYTNDLNAVPLIAPQYFERHWPEHYAARKIWYIGFVAVSPHAQGREAFSQLVEQMYHIASAQNGLVCLDICNHNDEVRRMSRVFRMMVSRLSDNMKFTRIDQQSYWLYEFPAAA